MVDLIILVLCLCCSCIASSPQNTDHSARVIESTFSKVRGVRPRTREVRPTKPFARKPSQAKPRDVSGSAYVAGSQEYINPYAPEEEVFARLEKEYNLQSSSASEALPDTAHITSHQEYTNPYELEEAILDRLEKDYRQSCQESKPSKSSRSSRPSKSKSSDKEATITPSWFPRGGKKLVPAFSERAFLNAPFFEPKKSTLFLL
jgi:hypothetical protein